MKKRNTLLLEAFRDESTGEIGLGLADMPRDETTNAAGEGLLIAHDIVEHVNGPRAIGTIDDELEALGAIWYVRGQHGELRRDSTGSNYTIEQNIASDVTRMFRDFFYGSHVTLSKPRTRPTDADDDFRAILKHAADDAPDELNQEDMGRAARARLRTYLAVCLPRMRMGYRKAQRKYEKHGRYFANNLFWAIADATDPYCKNAQEGWQYQLTYGIDANDRAFAHCEEYLGEDYE